MQYFLSAALLCVAGAVSAKESVSLRQGDLLSTLKEDRFVLKKANKTLLDLTEIHVNREAARDWQIPSKTDSELVLLAEMPPAVDFYRTASTWTSTPERS